MCAWRVLLGGAALLGPAPIVRHHPVHLSASVTGAGAHARWMLHALNLAEQGRFSTPPNPWVGCVIVDADGESVLAQGWHRQKGGPHAEAAALADAAARGVPRAKMERATCYVTLEPCHRGPGKTTAPCDEALVAAGIRTLHCALLDPDPSFGGGVAFLRANGVAVTVGTAADEVRASLRPYLHQRATARPWLVLKAACSADGAIACADGTSQWITGPAARAHAQLLRAASQAIIVGSGTAVADAPRLTVRLDDGALPDGALPPVRPALRVVLDARGRLRSGPLLDVSLAPTLVCTTDAAPADVRNVWADAGVEVAVVAAGENGEGVDVGGVLDELGKRGVVQAMVEGGGALLGSILAGRHAQGMRLYVGAKALGSTARRWIGAPLARTIEEAHTWQLDSVGRVGDSDDVCIEYDLLNADEEGDGRNFCMPARSSEMR